MTDIDPSKVKVGDRIEAECGGAKIAGKVAHIDSNGFVIIEHLRTFAIHGITENPFNGGYRMFVLTAHEPAEPEWKPGTVGTATVRGVEGVRVMRMEGVMCWLSSTLVKGHRQHIDVQVTGFAPDDTEALRTEITKLTVQLEAANAEVGEMDTEVKERRAEVNRLNGFIQSHANADRKALAEVEALTLARDANGTQHRLAAERADRLEAELERLRSLVDTSGQQLIEDRNRLQAEIDRLRADRALPTRELVESMLRCYSTTITCPGTDDFGAIDEYASRFMTLFEQGGAAPNQDAEGCPDDCGGCACHIAPPCSHCVEHTTDDDA